MPARSWRPFAVPAAFLAAVTLVVVGTRALWPHHPAHPGSRRAHATSAKVHAAPRFYRVRAGDTLATIAARTKTPVAKLRRLNPSVQPTSLFIGQRLRVR